MFVSHRVVRYLRKWGSELPQRLCERHRCFNMKVEIIFLNTVYRKCRIMATILSRKILRTSEKSVISWFYEWRCITVAPEYPVSWLLLNSNRSRKILKVIATMLQPWDFEKKSPMMRFLNFLQQTWNIACSYKVSMQMKTFWNWQLIALSDPSGLSAWKISPLEEAKPGSFSEWRNLHAYEKVKSNVRDDIGAELQKESGIHNMDFIWMGTLISSWNIWTQLMDNPSKRRRADQR